MAYITNWCKRNTKFNKLNFLSCDSNELHIFKLLEKLHLSETNCHRHFYPPDQHFCKARNILYFQFDRYLTHVITNFHNFFWLFLNWNQCFLLKKMQSYFVKSKLDAYFPCTTKNAKSREITRQDFKAGPHRASSWRKKNTPKAWLTQPLHSCT